MTVHSYCTLSEWEVEDVLRHPQKSWRSGRNSRIVVGQTREGRYLQVVIVPDTDGPGVFVVTAYDLKGKPLAALRRHKRRRGR
jgi:hypothetical protein